MRLPLALALALFVHAALPTPAHAASSTWQWRDAQGNIQFSDRPPPPHVPEKDILKRPPGAKAPIRLVSTDAASAPPAPAVAASAAAPSADERKAREAEAQRAKADEAARKAVEAKNAKIRAENCQAAQNYARDLQSGMRITRTNDKGEREFLDDPQRNAELAKTRATIASDCR